MEGGGGEEGITVSQLNVPNSNYITWPRETGGVGGVRLEGAERRREVDRNAHSHKTPDTEYCTGHQTLPTTPYPTLMNITHHLCVIIILIVCGYHHLNNCTI